MPIDRQESRLSAAHLRLFVTILMQNETIFNHFKSKLTVAHFTEESYQLLYRVLLDFYNENKSLPSFTEIWADLESMFEQDSEVISDASRIDLEDFLAYATDPDVLEGESVTSKKLENFALRAGKRMLMHAQTRDLQIALHQGVKEKDLPFVLQKTQLELEMLKTMGIKDKLALTFDSDWDKHDPKIIRTTGIGFLDKYLGGGTAEGEVYGIMAPYGTCKTTLAVMLWCETAKQCYEEILENGENKSGISVLVTYEAPKAPEILHRALMYAARVRRDSLDKMGMEGLSSLLDDPDNPLDYERKIFKQEIDDGVFKPERARVVSAVNWLNNHTLCLDFSGSDKDFPTAGSNGIDEIVQRIRLELRTRGPSCYVRNVIVDYLGLMVDRDVTLKQNDSKRQEDHKTYQTAVQRIARELCKPFNCHCFVFHQLSGHANSMLSPTKTLHHTDAKGSKSFGENLDFSFVIGNLNTDAMGQIACTKHRRFRKMPPSIIQVDGEFNSVIALNNYHVDSRGQIVEKSTMTTAGASVNDAAFSTISLQENNNNVEEIEDTEEIDYDDNE
jgi:hypothetical protein